MIIDSPNFETVREEHYMLAVVGRRCLAERA